MSLKSALTSRAMGYVTSEARLRSTRARAERKRRAANDPHVIEYFHQVDDPYSHLAAQALLAIRDRYAVEIRPRLVGPPADWAAPERARLIAYSRTDAARLAVRAGLVFVDPGAQPEQDRVATAGAVLAARLDAADFLELAVATGAALWSGSGLPVDACEGTPAGLAAAVAEGAARREALGHFMSAMLYYGGEWYWGVDRLYHLEQRLAELGARQPGAPDAPFYLEPLLPAGSGHVPSGTKLHFYLSFRSPYTSIAIDRVGALAEAYGAELELRFVLPMVMRGLPVPRMKSFYFALDTAREARRVGVPFGRIADPVGRPVERGYSLLPWARAQGRGFEYCRAFLRGAWAEGIDAGSDAGLRHIVEAAGLSWREARPLIGNDAWRAEAEVNRREMFERGLWGVPCFRVGDDATWGQDRLWVIEAELRRLSAAQPRGPG